MGTNRKGIRFIAGHAVSAHSLPCVQSLTVPLGSKIMSVCTTFLSPNLETGIIVNLTTKKYICHMKVASAFLCQMSNYDIRLSWHIIWTMKSIWLWSMSGLCGFFQLLRNCFFVLIDIFFPESVCYLVQNVTWQMLSLVHIIYAIIMRASPVSGG